MSLPTEPYSRIERYLAKLAGQDVDIPDKPITRIECYLDYIVNNGGGGGGGGFTPAPNAGAHNSIFRGQSLGTDFTADQSAAITGGTFEGLYIGDYWTINNTVYRIAGFDLYLESGNPKLTAHHAVIVPDNTLYNAQMNPTSTTAGGYLNSALKTEGLADALSQITTDFGASHVLTRKSYLTGLVTDGAPSGGTWTDTSVDLMTETIVIGRGSFATQNRNGYNIGNTLTQFPLFALMPKYIISNGSYWLQDVQTAESFSRVSAYGVILHSAVSAASTSAGVRPYFLIA